MSIDTEVATLEVDDVIFTFKATQEKGTNGNKGSGWKDYFGLSFSASGTSGRSGLFASSSAFNCKFFVNRSTPCAKIYPGCFLDWTMVKQTRQISEMTTVCQASKRVWQQNKNKRPPQAYIESIFIYIKLKIYFWHIHVTNMRNGISMI